MSADAAADVARHVPPGGSLRAGPFESERLTKLVALARERVPGFGFVHGGPLPFARLRRPLAEARVALVTTAGVHVRGDAPFRALEVLLGDPTSRWIPHALDAREVETEAGYVDAKFVGLDLECALPRRALDALVADGEVGAAAPRHASFVGGVVWAYPELYANAEALAGELRTDGVDAVVLTPTCSFCVQSVAVIGRALEASGLATVGLSLLPELSEVVGAPRTLAPHFPYGAPCGDPGNAALHRAVLREALGLVEGAESAGQVVRSRHAWRKPPVP